MTLREEVEGERVEGMGAVISDELLQRIIEAL